MTRYWGYRISVKDREFFCEEIIRHGRLRQGWGWDQKQDLRELQMDEGAKRNISMFNNVKKGDILIVPHLKEYGVVSIVNATEDWDTGYKFEISEKRDFGHIFPAQYLRSFVRKNTYVSGNIRSTLRNPSRFWNIDHYEEDIRKILDVPEDRLLEGQRHEERMKNSIITSFDEKIFSDMIFEKMNKEFTQAEWEYVLVYGLKLLFPFYQVERVGGTSEKNHGTDILIRLPGIKSEYAIAIQVKDYEGTVGTDVIHQINKADWFEENRTEKYVGLKLIDKIVIITKALKEEHKTLIDEAYKLNITFIFASELKEILCKIGKRILADSDI